MFKITDLKSSVGKVLENINSPHITGKPVNLGDVAESLDNFSTLWSSPECKHYRESLGNLLFKSHQSDGLLEEYKKIIYFGNYMDMMAKIRIHDFPSIEFNLSHLYCGLSLIESHEEVIDSYFARA